MAKFGSPTAVLLAAPQICGYLRAILYVFAFANVDGAEPLAAVGLGMPGWQLCIILYFAAFAIDVIDGKVARALDQCSFLGGVLDIVLDLTGTSVLLTTLAGAFPAYRLHFGGLIALNVASHWMHIVSTQQGPNGRHQGPNGGHHKTADSMKNRNIIVKIYYGVYPFFGYCCIGTELFYILLLALAYAPAAAIGPITLSGVARYVCFPACILKNIVNVMQLWSAMFVLAALDVTAEKDEPNKVR